MKGLRFAISVVILGAAASAFAAQPTQHPRQGGPQSTASTGGAPQSAPANSDVSSSLSQIAPGVGVMVNLHGGTFAMVNRSTYQLNESSAASQFANTFTGEIDCVDQAGEPCSIGDAPAAPAPDPTQVTQAVDAQACTFLAGGALQPFSYVQIITISPVPYDYTWKEYFYHYDVEPNTASVRPLTAWSVAPAQPRSRSGAPAVSVTGEVVNELVTFPKAGDPMYAFMTGSFVSNLQLTVNNNPVAVYPTTIQNCPGCLPGQNGSRDFTFYPNVGTMGDALSYVKSGDARKILSSDHYSGNDNGGPNGNALQMTTFRTQPLQLAPGMYSLLMTGKSAGIQFMVSANLQIVSPTCSVR